MSAAEIWRIATEGPQHQANDLSGKGAEISGGRWNRPGRPMVYAASSISLACLETVVHLNAGSLPLNRFLVRIPVPAAVWAKRQTLKADQLPSGWNAVPESKVSLDIGDRWLQDGASALLVLPSAIVPEEFNVLINPRHADAAAIRAEKLRPWRFDGRLL